MEQSSLIRLLRELKIEGANIIVHSSLAAFGSHLEGGARSLCEALIEAVGSSGTIVMPAFTYTETLLGAAESPVPFHPELPVSRVVGAVAEAFRTWPGVLRSNHPTHSFSARGRQAVQVLSTQRDNNPLGPIKKLNIMQGHIVLLGAPLSDATALHLAEETAPLPYLGRGTASRINLSGFTERVVVEHLPGCGSAFARLEERLDPASVTTVALPQDTGRKLSIRSVVRLASAVLAENPAAFICDQGACKGCAVKRAALGSRAALAR